MQGQQWERKQIPGLEYSVRGVCPTLILVQKMKLKKLGEKGKLKFQSVRTEPPQNSA